MSTITPTMTECMTFEQELGIVIRSEIERSGHTKRHMAEVCGISVSTLWRRLAGMSGSFFMDELWLIARELGTTGSALLDAAEQPERAA